MELIKNNCHYNFRIHLILYKSTCLENYMKVKFKKITEKGLISFKFRVYIVNE